MKKRLLSALLALALVFVLLPTTALAGVTTENDYDISINGIGWKFDKEDNSDAYIPVYFYGNDPLRYFFSTKADDNWASNSNLKLTKEGNTVTITIRPKKNHIPGNTIEFTLEKKPTTSGEPNDYTPCIEMGNNNNLVITGKGTLNITRDEKNGIGAALCSEVGDITITDGITVKANFLKQVSNSTVGNAISVKDHNLIISGKNTKVEARNSSCNFQDLYYVSAAVCVENGEIKVSDGATLDAANSYTNPAGSRYSYYSRAISGSNNNPCTLTVTGENSCVIAKTDNSLGKAYGHVNFSIDGAKIEVGTSSPAQTITDINNIKNYKYAKISIPALQKTSDVRIAGGPAVVGQWTTITANSCSGSYYYDAAKKELTLKDVNITRNNNNNIHHAIQFTKNGDYTINLEGTNNISSVANGICALNKAFYDDPANISVTITGTGSLNVTANTYAIDMQVGNLIFNSTGNITLTTNCNFVDPRNALHVAGKITIDNTKYDIVGKRQDAAETTETISDSSEFDPAYLNGYTVGGETTLFKTITITPAAPKKSTISYGGTTLTQGETIKDGKGGTATVDREKNTITLNNFKGTQALSFDATIADSTLVLEGTNTLSSIVTTQKGLTISGSGSLTAGSIKVTNNDNIRANLTITNGAKVTVNRPGNEDDRAIDIKGNLTVTNAALTATSNSTKPTVQVGGNASFTGSTVTITNNSTELHKDATEATKGDSVSSALYVKGNINITDNANVTAKVENGGGNAIGALGDITVNGSNVTAANKGQKFTTIIAENVYISGESTITANNLNKNPPYHGSYLACPAIEGNIVNKNTDYSLKFEGEHSSSSEPKTTLAPGEQTTLYYYNVTITCGDEVTRTNSPVVIAGTTLLNDTYYTITNGSTVAVGTDENNYNAFYDSASKTLKLNNAKISTTTDNAAIEIRGDLAITVTGTNELKGNYNHCIESWSNFTINGTGTLNMTNTSSSSSAASVIYCGPYKNLTIAAEVIIKNEAKPGNLIFTVEKDAYSFAEGYNVYASTDVSGSPLEAYDAAKGSTYKYLRVTKENLAPTTPTTYTVTITAGDNMKIERESGALTQEVTKGAAITEVKFMAASGHYFPADYVSKMNLPAGLTAEIRENSWYLIISGTPTSDVTINLPAASVRPTITVSMPTPAAGNTPATASDITLTYSDINKSISKNLTISNVVWQSYVSNGDGSITPGNTLSSGDKFVEGTKYRATINFEGVSEDYAIVPAAGTTKWSNAEWGSSTMTLYFDATGAPCTHEYTDDWHANGNTHWHECKQCRAHADEVAHTFGDWITDTPATDTTDGSKHRICSVCQYQENATIPKTGTGEIEPPTPDNPGTIVIIRPAEEEKPAQQPNPSTGANDLVGMAVAAAVVAVLGSVALLRKHD